jgi:hypothetical protein
MSTVQERRKQEMESRLRHSSFYLHTAGFQLTTACLQPHTLSSLAPDTPTAIAVHENFVVRDRLRNFDGEHEPFLIDSAPCFATTMRSVR